MSVRQTSAVAIKFLGLWLILNIIIYIPGLAFQAVGVEHLTGERVDRVAIALFVGTYFILGLMVCYVLFRVADSVLKSASDEGGSGQSRVSERFLLQLIGAYFFVSAATDISGFIPSLLGFEYGSTKELWYLPGVALELMLGLWIIVRPALWSEWLLALRRPD